ncbi:sulfotransferase family protein [Zhongshania marina]|uniref:Sulfotransferase n=1 Tax=Zhongshania marina TaxID=2304603 RepID=A0ABX9W5R1_9GAMM|nr:sulfotransferase [Zhongshania marina]
MNPTSNEITQQTSVMTSQSLMAQATEEEKLDDYGTMDFVGALDQLVSSVCKEGHLSPMGLMGFNMGIVNFLRNRLRFQDDLKKHPEILDEDVSDPIIITGLSRTGTTKLQRIMASDTQTQKLLTWQCINPAPLTTSVNPDPRIAVAKANVGAFRQAAPDFMSAHSMDAEIPEEDSMLFQATFESSTEGYFYRAPSYMDWLWNHRPLNSSYAYFRNLVRYLQWQNGGVQGRPWVLKGTPHLGLLDEVLTAFPNATIVQCHRNPTAAVPSLCRLVEAGREARGSEHIDLHEIGEFFGTFCPAMWERQIEQLGRVKDKANILDVHYNRIRDDAVGVVRDIYERRGMSLSKEGIKAMTQWEADNPQHSEGRHVYSLERYGLCEQRIQQSFKTYFDYFPAELTK